MATPSKRKPPQFKTTLLDPAVPWDVKLQHLTVMFSDPEGHVVLQEILAAAAAGSAGALAEEKLKAVNELIRSLGDGPLRPATFFASLPPAGMVTRASVRTEDGHKAFVVVTGEGLATKLRRGEGVMLDAKMNALVATDPAPDGTGEVGRLVRRIDKDVLEVEFHAGETHLLLASAALADRLDAGTAAPGAQVRACRRRGIAFDALPPVDGLSHYRFVSRKPVPDVVVGRDIGCPPAFIEELADHVRMVLHQPELMRRFRVRPSAMKLLTGVPGTGKTYAIHAVWRLLYELMSQATGLPIDRLPPRVLELRAPAVLSKYLGESDKHLDRFFDEAEQLADELFDTPDGRRIRLPVLVVVEECEALGRTRGGAETDAIYDRLQTTLLQRLDPTSPRLRDRPILFCFTTNAPGLCDPAFIRRAGGTTHRFGRLSRAACRQVLCKHLAGLPFRTDNGHTPQELEREAAARITAWLFSHNPSDKGLLEVTYVGTAAPVVKHRRDLLTPALLDRAVQQAAAEACREARGGDLPSAGLTAERIASAIERQARSVVEQLTRENVADYIDLPDGARVATVRRVPQTSALPFDLVRNT